MATKPNITISGPTWVSLNSLSGTDIGAEFNIQNTSYNTLLLSENTLPPSNNSTDGQNLYSRNTVKVTPNSLEVWARPINLHSSIIVVINS